MQTDVLFAIYLKLLASPSVSAGRLADEFELSRRTVYRYIDILCASGLPILSRAGASGGYSIAEEYKIGTMYFTKEEQEDIIGALVNMTKLGKKTSALEKMRAVSRQLAQETFAGGGLVIDGEGWGSTNSQSRKIAVLSAAREKRVAVEFDYLTESRGEKQRRTVEPHVFIFKEGSWYLYAFCRLRGDFRLFRTGRISNIRTTDEQFELRPLGAEAPWNSSFREQAKTVRITLGFDESVRPAIEEWLGEDCINGNTAEADVYYSGMLTARILSLGAGVTVLSPGALRSELLAAARSVCEKYKNN